MSNQTVDPNKLVEDNLNLVWSIVNKFYYVKEEKGKNKKNWLFKKICCKNKKNKGDFLELVICLRRHWSIVRFAHVKGAF